MPAERLDLGDQQVQAVQQDHGDPQAVPPADHPGAVLIPVRLQAERRLQAVRRISRHMIICRNMLVLILQLLTSDLQMLKRSTVCLKKKCCS